MAALQVVCFAKVAYGLGSGSDYLIFGARGQGGKTQGRGERGRRVNDETSCRGAILSARPSPIRCGLQLAVITA